MTQTTLTLAEIIRETGIDRNALNRYLQEPDTRNVLGGTHTHPLYPLEKLPLFHKLAQLHKDKTVKPKSLAAYLRIGAPELDNRTANEATEKGELLTTPERNQGAHSLTALANAALASRSEFEYSNSSNTEQALTIAPDSIQEAATALAAALIRAGIVVGQDRLLTASEAGEMLACGARGVAWRVPPVGKGVYRLSDVQSFIRDLEPLRRRCSLSE